MARKSKKVTKSSKSKRASSVKTQQVKMQNDLIALLATGLIAVAFILLLVNNTPKTESRTVVNAPIQESSMTSRRYILGEQNNSQESGIVYFSENNGKTTVTISLDNFPKDVSQPAHIHFGVCHNPESIAYPLKSVVNGKSETVLNMKLRDLLEKLPLAVNVHKSETDAKTYVSCGNLQK